LFARARDRLARRCFQVWKVDALVIFDDFSVVELHIEVKSRHGEGISTARSIFLSGFRHNGPAFSQL
jgi:hypothetical protein